MLEKKQFYINGAWVDSIDGVEHNVINPSTEEPCAVVMLGGQVRREVSFANVEVYRKCMWRIKNCVVNLQTLLLSRRILMLLSQLRKRHSLGGWTPLWRNALRFVKSWLKFTLLGVRILRKQLAWKWVLQLIWQGAPKLLLVQVILRIFSSQVW